MAPPRGELGELSDRELVLAFQTAHPDAYEEIFRRHNDRVRRVCIKMLRDPHDAEEATQEAFLRAYKALGRFNGRYQLGAWLARIATNICLDEIRKSKTHIALAPIGDGESVEASSVAPSDLVVERTEVERSMGEIAPLHARALMLQAVQGMSHKEMAGALEMTAPQVKSLLHRARRSFRAAWQEASGWLIAPMPLLRSVVSGEESRPAGDVTAGAGVQLSSTLVERIATGTVAAVIAIGGMGLGTEPALREHPRRESVTSRSADSGSKHREVLAITDRRTSSFAASSEEAPADTSSDAGNTVSLKDVTGDLPTHGGDNPDDPSDDDLIDTPPTTTGEDPADGAVRRAVDLANDTAEAGNGKN